jgi:hypothetical protein
VRLVDGRTAAMVSPPGDADGGKWGWFAMGPSGASDGGKIDGGEQAAKDAADAVLEALS